MVHNDKYHLPTFTSLWETTPCGLLVSFFSPGLVLLGPKGLSRSRQYLILPEHALLHWKCRMWPDSALPDAPESHLSRNDHGEAVLLSWCRLELLRLFRVERPADKAAPPVCPDVPARLWALTSHMILCEALCTSEHTLLEGMTCYRRSVFASSAIVRHEQLRFFPWLLHPKIMLVAEVHGELLCLQRSSLQMRESMPLQTVVSQWWFEISIWAEV